MSPFDFLVLGLIALIAIGVAAGVYVVAQLLAADRRRGQAVRLLITLQALEQMGEADTPEYDELNRRYAALEHPMQGYPVPFAD